MFLPATEIHKLETINMDAVYPLGWTTIVESVALLLMEVSIVFEELLFRSRENG